VVLPLGRSNGPGLVRAAREVLLDGMLRGAPSKKPMK
jgi:hypothetical protein